MTEAQKVNALISLYEKLYKDKYGRKPTINRYKDKWGFTDMLKDLGQAEAIAIVEYYFETPRPGHPLVQLFRNYELMSKIKHEKAQDEAKRAELREETEKRVKEWNEQRVTRSEADKLDLQRGGHSHNSW